MSKVAFITGITGQDGSKFIEKAFELKCIHLGWKGEGVNEIGYDTYTGILGLIPEIKC